MLFENPWLLLGLSAAAIPVIIHLVNRRKAPVRRFAAIDFILLSNKRLMRRMKVKNWLVLLVRMLLIAAIPFALARPYSVPDEAMAAMDQAPGSTVIVLDDSMSMGARVDGQPLLTTAVQQAREMIGRLGRESNVGLVLASAPAEPLTAELTFNHDEVLAALARVEEAGPSARVADPVGALRIAEALLADSALPERRVVVLSDLQQTSWGGLDRPWSLETPPPVEVIDVAPADRALANAGVTAVVVERAVDVSPRHVRVTVEVAAFERPFDDVVTVRVAGRTMKNSLQVAPGERGSTAFLLKLDASNVEAGAASIPEDALPADNARSFTVDFLRTVSVLIVNGAPRSIPYRDEVFFLDKAYRAGGEEQTRIQTLTMRADEVTPQQLERVDVVVLANVLKLREDVMPALRRFVRSGGGLLIAGGDNVTPAYNDLFGGLLPLPVRDVKAVVKRGAPGAHVKALSLDTVRFEHPALRIFRNLEGSSLFSARFYTYLLLDGTVPADVSVVASYDNGAPLLVEKAVGAGRVMMLTTTVDRDWSDLAIRTSFLPLVQQLTLHLADRLERAVPSAVLVGEHYPIQLTEGTERVVVEAPDGRTEVYDQPMRDGVRSLVYDATTATGVYTVRKTMEGVGEPVVERFTANADPREMDTARLSVSAVIEALQPGDGSDNRRVAPLSGDSPWRTNLWPYVLVGLFGLLISETALVVRS